MGVDLFVASRQFVCNQSENSIKLSRAGLYFRYNNMTSVLEFKPLMHNINYDSCSVSAAFHTLFGCVYNNKKDNSDVHVLLFAVELPIA